MSNAIVGLRRICTGIAVLILSFVWVNPADAQVYKIKDGRMFIEVSKNITAESLESFIEKYDLADLALNYFVRTNKADSLHMQGWKVERNDNGSFAISKPMLSADDLHSVAEKFTFADGDAGITSLFPAISGNVYYGYNNFRNKNSFASQDSIVTFFMRGRLNAKKVILAGSFNNWDPRMLEMEKTDSGWIRRVKLGPGKYWYKFIADGNWLVDEDNLQKENDGRGNTNSVFYKTNFVFALKEYPAAKKVYVSGNFNNWRPQELLMTRTPNGWEIPLYLADGTHTYKFVVDGNWKFDPANPEKYPNEFNDYNSVIRIGNPTLFTLKGFQNARKVLLAGSFNGWRKDELYMTKTSEGWVIAYTLGPGNYEYRFVVDGKEMTDPANPITVNKNRRDSNSYLIIAPNYTFRLRGYPNAKKVFLGGDFNGFDSDGIPMKKAGEEWVFSLHLSRGKHLYKFVVDGEWIKDPDNKLWEQNRFKTGDSVVWIGEQEPD